MINERRRRRLGLAAVVAAVLALGACGTPIAEIGPAGRAGATSPGAAAAPEDGATHADGDSSPVGPGASG